MINIGLADDHQLFLKSLGLMIESFPGCKVVLEAPNGEALLQKLQALKNMPDIMLLDVNMPVMNGFETARQLTEKYPAMKLVALSMNADDKSIIGMLKAGCCGYLLKDTHPTELEKALNEIQSKGYYNGDAANINFRRLLISEKEEEAISLSEKEKRFLQLACSDFTYKHIAGEMGISERSVDLIRENMFQKLKVQSRVGLCLEAIKKGLVNV